MDRRFTQGFFTFGVEVPPFQKGEEESERISDLVDDSPFFPSGGPKEGDFLFCLPSTR